MAVLVLCKQDYALISNFHLQIKDPRKELGSRYFGMPVDVRDKPYLNHTDVVGLNFINAFGMYVFRRHYRAGLRSHILEVLHPADVQNEEKGIIIHGTRWYPRAKPLKMLRIFRTRFNSLRDAEAEIQRVKIIERYLGPDNFGRSEEFLVDYRRNGEKDILLCGLQEYVAGKILDPWGHLDANHLVSLRRQTDSKLGADSARNADRWLEGVLRKGEAFVGKLKRMILETHHVPDLAGFGNLLLTRSGDIKLVDINNISRVSLDSAIKLDDRGYPVCDKSIEALSLLEQKLLGRCAAKDDPVYRLYLDPERMNEVKAMEREFYLSLQPAIAHPDSSPS